MSNTGADTMPMYRNGLQFSLKPEMEPNNSDFRFEFVVSDSDVYYTFLMGGSNSGVGVVSRFVLN
ncbi:unnamed protein product [Miscanthus lutarioriparius]|uniref:Uncharacterized protein n=1 Tax=Miscanthus lutarioriparius TaxID=422564 RepID=A0A811P485_9POAL|nr:unnamed protein product [Miscanthus lutarioriparius]